MNYLKHHYITLGHLIHTVRKIIYNGHNNIFTGRRLEKKYVQIDLEKYCDLWPDFLDIIIAIHTKMKKNTFLESEIIPTIIFFKKNYVFIILKIKMLVKSFFANQFILSIK